MRGNEYQELAQVTSNKELAPEMHLLNGALGLCGEGGEVADIVKKWKMQGHEIDINHIAEELGDVLWYVAETATAIGYSLDEIMENNIEKLKKRYPEGFSSEKSVNRAERAVN